MQPLAAPRRLEVVREERGHGRIVQAQHQVVPAEIVIAEVETAQVRDVAVDHDRLLVAARGQPPQERTGRVDVAHGDAGAREGIVRGVRGADFGLEYGVPGSAGPVHGAAAQHVAAERIHREPAVRATAADQQVRERAARGVALERHGLRQHGL